MDRRDFFKTALATPVLASLLLTSKKIKSDCDLYLITDDPQLFISLILEEVQKYVVKYGQNFTLLNPHPQGNSLRRILSQRDWIYVQKTYQADLTLSFTHLRHKALPSFTLVREGRIWDIRSRKLRTLWGEMNKNNKPSSCLTIASFKNSQSDPFSGEFVSVYKDGRKIDMISLQENFTKSFRAKGGKITLRVEDGIAWISESSCRHKICLYSPPVSLAGERIICVPNHFLLEIKGSHSIDTAIG